MAATSKLTPLQQTYFDLLRTQGVVENETAVVVKRAISTMNAVELRQAIAASQPAVPDHRWSQSRR